MNILFYYPDKERSVSLSSLMIEFQKQGHQVFLLTHAEEGMLHEDVKSCGVKTFSYPVKKTGPLVFYLKHIKYLASFVKKNKIDLVYSHIQLANFISVFTQFFCKARFIICRHHSDCAFLDNNFNEKLFDKIINRLGREFIVPSEKVYTQMTLIEKASSKKIHLIRYAYDFSAYAQPDVEISEELRARYKAQLILIKVARHIPEKRHLLLFKVINKLIKKGLDIKLLVLSNGPNNSELLDFVNSNGLQNHIFMLGYKTDVMNYLSAADMVVHVSESEASNSLVKESGLLMKPVVVCRDVGDFDEYLVNGENSLLLPKNDPSESLEKIIKEAYERKLPLEKIGNALYNTIIERFSIQYLIKEYDKIHVST